MSINVSQPKQRLSEFYQNSLYARYEQEHRCGGSFNMNAMTVSKSPYDSETPAFDEWVFSYCWNDVHYSYLDIGDGRKEFKKSPGGTICVVPPHVEVKCGTSSNVTLSFIAIPAQTVEQLLLESGIKVADFLPSAGTIRQVAGIGETVRSLWCASARGGPSASLLIDADIMKLLALVANQYCDGDGARNSKSIRIARVFEYIEASLSEPMTVPELASVAGLSPAHFSKCFKATTGEKVWTYVQRRRCERAREALQFTREPIAQIALACGFANQGHLTNVFKKSYGLTPYAMRRSVS